MAALCRMLICTNLAEQTVDAICGPARYTYEARDVVFGWRLFGFVVTPQNHVDVGSSKTEGVDGRKASIPVPIFVHNL